MKRLFVLLLVATFTVAGVEAKPKKKPCPDCEKKEQTTKKDKPRPGSKKGRPSRSNSLRGVISKDDKLSTLFKNYRAKQSAFGKKTKDVIGKLKDKESTDEIRMELRKKLSELRKTQAEVTKKHRQEVQKRLKELGKDDLFKNSREAILNNERRGDRERRRRKPND